MRRAAIAGAVVVFLLGALIVVRPFLAAQRDQPSSVPSPASLTATDTVPLKKGSPACFRWGVAERHSEVIRFKVSSPSGPAPPISVRLTGGDYAHALDLSRQAQALAPRGSSAHVQATAQEGRAWARMRRSAETLDALARVERRVAGMTAPERPEPHCQYDPAKAMAYTATTLAWVGDPAAVDYARAALARLLAADDGVTRPRRIASARLDLSLSLLGAGRADEAASVATDAVASGRVVASNWWRAAEVLAGVEAAGAVEAVELRNAYETFRPRGNG